MEARTPIGPRADPLGEALHLLRMDGAFYCRSELGAPWGFSLEAMPGHMWFHVVTSGAMWLDYGEGEPLHLRPGELALVTHGGGHALRGDPDAPAPDIHELGLERITERYETLCYDGGGERTTLVCGAVRFDHPAARGLVDVLPGTILVEAARSPQMERMQNSLSLLAVEARDTQPGGEAVITRLADILVIQAIRSWIDTDPAARTGWLGALQDAQIGRAVALVHADPARDWSVAGLADAVAMSRSAFSARFTELVGEPAMAYLTRWRMHVARDELQQGAGVAELAMRLGYGSEAAFARAFKRVTGETPGAIRRAAVR